MRLKLPSAPVTDRMYSQNKSEGLGVTSSGTARLAEQKGQGKNQQKGAAVEAGKHKSQPGTAKQDDMVGAFPFKSNKAA
ncbi:hypothetical protein WJX79_007996, partial [Trebouxia sp. C0005]